MGRHVRREQAMRVRREYCTIVIVCHGDNAINVGIRVRAGGGKLWAISKHQLWGKMLLQEEESLNVCRGMVREVQ